MPITESPRRMPAVNCDGVQDTFPFNFPVFQTEDVRVVLLNTDTSVETELVLNIDYTVALNGDQDSNPGGNVATTTPPADNRTLTIVGGMPYNQTTALPDGGAYRAENVQLPLDRLSIQIQQLKEEIDRCAKVPVSGGDADALNNSINVLSANLVTLQTIVSNISDLITLANNIGDVNTLAAVRPQLSALAASLAELLALHAVLAKLLNVETALPEILAVEAALATIAAVAAEIPNLALKVSKDSDTGSARLPAGTSAQRTPAPAWGDTRVNTEVRALEVWDDVAAQWVPAGQGATGPIGNPVVYENDQVIQGEYSLQAGKDAGHFGPLVWGSGSSITIPSGAVLVIVD